MVDRDGGGAGVIRVFDVATWSNRSWGQGPAFVPVVDEAAWSNRKCGRNGRIRADGWLVVRGGLYCRPPSQG